MSVALERLRAADAITVAATFYCLANICPLLGWDGFDLDAFQVEHLVVLGDRLDLCRADKFRIGVFIHEASELDSYGARWKWRSNRSIVAGELSGQQRLLKVRDLA